MRASLRTHARPGSGLAPHRLTLRAVAALLAALVTATGLAGCGAGGPAGDSPLKGGGGSGGATAPADTFGIATTSLPAGQPGVAYPTITLTTVAAPGPVAWTLSGGRLPEGLSLSEAGVLAGTPVEEGFSALTVTALSGGLSATRTFGLSIGVFGLVVSDGLVQGTAWSGEPVTLLAAGAAGTVRFEVVEDGSGGRLSTEATPGLARWLPGTRTGPGRADRLAAVDGATGARAEVSFGVERDPTAGFVAEFGSTDVWYVDTGVKVGAHGYATDLHAVLAATGLRDPSSTGRSGTPADRLAELCVHVSLLRWLNVLYGRNPDGSAGSGLPISFAYALPAGYEAPAPGSWLEGGSTRYSVLGLAHGTRPGVLGTAFTDGATNAQHENDTTTAGAGELGVFGNQMTTTFNVAYNNYDLPVRPVGADDLAALENVLYGRGDRGGRTSMLLGIVDGLGRTLAAVAAHEIGHSLGLPHTNPSVAGSLMNGTTVISPQAGYAFLPQDLAALRARLPGVGRFGGSAKPSATRSLPSGGLAVCGAEPGRCDLLLATSPARPAGVPAWALPPR